MASTVRQVVMALMVWTVNPGVTGWTAPQDKMASQVLTAPMENKDRQGQ